MDNIVKINYTLDLPYNDFFRKELEAFLERTGQLESSLKNHHIERFLKDYIRDLLDNIREDYPDFDGKFVLDLRHDRVKGIFKSSYQVKGSYDEPLRRKIFDRFMKLVNSDDLRVDINLNCMI